MFLEVAAPGRGVGGAWRQSRCASGVDLAVLFPNSFRSALVGLAGRLPAARRLQPLRPRAAADRCAAAARGARTAQLQPSPIIDAYNRLAERAGCPRPGYRMELFTTPGDEAAADAVWQAAASMPHREVSLPQSGAAFGSAKHWHAESFAALAQELVRPPRQRRAGSVRPGERELARRIAA